MQLNLKHTWVDFEQVCRPIKTLFLNFIFEDMALFIQCVNDLSYAIHKKKNSAIVTIFINNGWIKWLQINMRMNKH